jgi:hypothetical protein
VTEGLLYVESERGTVSELEFHDWYDHEHGPNRVGLKDVAYGQRYHAADDLSPSWMALYGLEIEVLGRDDYLYLRDHQSAREISVMERLETLDRRVYHLLSDTGTNASERPATFLVAVSMDAGEVGDTKLDEWYIDEHIPLLRQVPGWRSTRRYRLAEGEGMSNLALHEWEGISSFDSEEYQKAISTPWRNEIMDSLAGHARRVFRHHRTILAADRPV